MIAARACIRGFGLCLAGVLALAGCGTGPSDKPVTLSVIGAPADPNRLGGNQADLTARTMTSAMAQGLVGFDGAGQVEPALAERWIIIDGGLNYIFRIAQANWPDGRAVTSAEVAQILRRNINAGVSNGSAPMLRGVTSVVPMTPMVIELRLSAPLPGLLKRLAQPDMAIIQRGGGTGPYRFHSRRDGVTRLRQIPLPDEAGELPDIAEQEPFDMRLRGEPVNRAIVRFVNEGTDLVVGGRFQDLPYVSATDPGTGRFRIDATRGLFGLRFTNSTGPLGESEVRIALSSAINRSSLVAAIRGESWQPAISVLPDQLDSNSRPAALDLLQRNQSDRARLARSKLLGRNIRVRVSLPPGPGSRLVFASLARDWNNVGVKAILVPRGAPADLVLIDEVAPMDTALWYIGRLGCQQRLPCSAAAEELLDAAIKAKTAAERGAAIAEADAMLAAAHYYIPLAVPLRWSLVDPELTGWRDNDSGVHPLIHLRPPARQ